MNQNVKLLSVEEIGSIGNQLQKITESIGLETYPFKVGWYNEAVSKSFHLNYHPDTVAFVVLSIPAMFEKCLIPFIKDDKYDCLSAQDPLDQCMRDVFQNIIKSFPDCAITCIHDYEVHPNRRPKILVQTAGHVSAAAYYYRQEELKKQPSGQKLYGVSIHPKYGGWFAFRGILIFENVACQDLIKTLPEDVVKTDEQKLELLKKFNFSWKDWSYRDVIETPSKYSEEQRLFFMTPPSERKSLMEIMKESKSPGGPSQNYYNFS